MTNKGYITASEISEYLFCRRGWWLRINGLLVVNQHMMNGTENHIRISENVISNSKKERAIKLILTIGFILLLISLILFLLKL